MDFKDYSIFNSGGNAVQWSKTIWTVLVEGLMRKSRM